IPALPVIGVRHPPVSTLFPYTTLFRSAPASCGASTSKVSGPPSCWRRQPRPIAKHRRRPPWTGSAGARPRRSSRRSNASRNAGDAKRRIWPHGSPTTPSTTWSGCSEFSGPELERGIAMAFPIVQFISPVPSPLPTEGSEPMPGGFAELIDALLDSLVGSDEALPGFDERAEVPEEPQTGDETARTAFPSVAAALAATPPVLPGESAPQPVAEPATGADSASDMVEAVADRIPQYAVPGGVPAPSAPAAPVPDDRDPPLTLDPEPVPGTGHDAGLDPVPAPAVG